ncbi:MAG: SRPBCC family protein [Pseudomonadota bacterium]
MHLLTEKTVHIQRPALAVFGYVSNMENFGEWFPGVIAIQSANALQHGQPGKQYLETVLVPLRGTRKITVQVREVRDHQFFATEGRFPPLMPRMELTVDATGENACTFTYRVFSRSDSLIARYTLLPLARRVMGHRAAVGVAALKQRLEAGTP